MTIEYAVISAKPGQYIRCDIFGAVIEIVDYLTNGLGIIYKVQADGSLRRYVF
jgi:hypothetical protein